MKSKKKKELVLKCLSDWISAGMGDECFWEEWPACPTEILLTPNMVLELLEDNVKIMKQIELNEEEIAILDHTVNRAAGGRYCGDSDDMDILVDKGLMKCVGTVAWCPDKFYTITEEGRSILKQYKFNE